MSSLIVSSYRFQIWQHQWDIAKQVPKGTIDPIGFAFRIRIHQWIDQTVAFWYGERSRADTSEQDLYWCTVT